MKKDLAYVSSMLERRLRRYGYAKDNYAACQIAVANFHEHTRIPERHVFDVLSMLEEPDARLLSILRLRKIYQEPLYESI